MENTGRKHRKSSNKRKLTLLIIILVLIIVLAVVAVIGSKRAAALELKQQRIQETIASAEQMIQGYFYDEAIELLMMDSELYDETNSEDPIIAKVLEAEALRTALVKYEGPIEHIFFHSLIVYPELAFDDYGHPAEGYNMWMTTVDEFKAMLPYLYEDGFILYPLNEYIEDDPLNPGKIKLKDIYLPPGKKPLVISIDDVNYYDYMKPDGFANRLVLGDDGRVWTEVITPDGEVTLTRDGDVMPILDDFVAEHPDFSYRGAKGVMALTGYQGALGYRITDDLPEEAKWQQEVKAIADTMKADGWLFACHSYTHNQYFNNGKVTMEQMIYDTDRWIQKIAPWVGETNIYISPFGWHWNNNNSIHRYIAESGYQIFCPVGNARRITVYDDIISMPRVNLDGYTMNKRASEVEKYYFPVDQVMDKMRPPLEI